MFDKFSAPLAASLVLASAGVTLAQPRASQSRVQNFYDTKRGELLQAALPGERPAVLLLA
jgi:hypothetical protein